METHSPPYTRIHGGGGFVDGTVRTKPGTIRPQVGKMADISRYLSESLVAHQRTCRGDPYRSCRRDLPAFLAENVVNVLPKRVSERAHSRSRQTFACLVSRRGGVKVVFKHLAVPVDSFFEWSLCNGIVSIWPPNLSSG